MRSGALGRGVGRKDSGLLENVQIDFGCRHSESRFIGSGISSAVGCGANYPPECTRAEPMTVSALGNVHERQTFLLLAARMSAVALSHRFERRHKRIDDDKRLDMRTGSGTTIGFL